MLQERLDSLTSKQVEKLVEESVVSELARVLNANAQKDVKMKEMQKEALQADEGFTESSHDGGKNVKDPHKELVSHLMDVKGGETTEPIVIHQELNVQQDNGTKEAQMTSGIGCQEAKSKSHMELGGEPGNDNAPAMVESLDTNVTLPMPEHSIDLPLVPEKNSSSDDYVGNIKLSHNTIEKGITQVARVHDVAPITKKPKGDKLSFSP
ncbi:hypothetical protein SLA2020_511960 [Shorea laevis]